MGSILSLCSYILCGFQTTIRYLFHTKVSNRSLNHNFDSKYSTFHWKNLLTPTFHKNKSLILLDLWWYKDYFPFLTRARPLAQEQSLLPQTGRRIVEQLYYRQTTAIQLQHYIHKQFSPDDICLLVFSHTDSEVCLNIT